MTIEVLVAAGRVNYVWYHLARWYHHARRKQVHIAREVLDLESVVEAKREKEPVGRRWELVVRLVQVMFRDVTVPV